MEEDNLLRTTYPVRFLMSVQRPPVDHGNGFSNSLEVSVLLVDPIPFCRMYEKGVAKVLTVEIRYNIVLTIDDR